MRKARILMADDHPLVRDGCRSLLANAHEIVGAVSDGRSLTEAALRLKPDLIVLDISMPSLNGLEAARQIKAALPEAKLLFLTMHSERSYIQAAFEAGAAGYVLKSEEPEELLRAVEQVLAGRLYVPKDLPVILRNTSDPDRVAKALTLTAREREVLQLIAEGKSTKDIAHILYISVKTVEYHRENIKRKLGETTIAGLTRIAIAGGLV
jgi:DNA-binding NarL/FixJ family response regulator